MAKVFISYSRKDIEFAKRLTGELQKGDLDFWIDWEGIPPTVDWWKEIEKGIEDADIFLFLISPDSVKSKVCGQEIDHAVQNGKRLIPLVVRDIKAEEAPRPLASLNWIFFRETDDFNGAIKKLLTSIHTDYAWVQTHRRLQVRALEWERNHRENSFLLRGKDLQDAEAQITANVAKDPKPTELQTQYVHTSRQGESRRQRNLLSGVGVALVLSIGLGILAFVNGQNATRNANNYATQVVIAEAESNFRATEQSRAEEQTRIALSRSLATGARLNLDKQYDLSLLMAVEALNLDPSIEAKSALFDSLEHVPQAVKYYNLGFQSSYMDYYQQLNGMIDFSYDGRYIAARMIGPDIYLVDTEAKALQPEKLIGHGANVMALQFNATRDELYSLDENGTFIRWDLQTLQPKDQLQITLLFSTEAGGGSPLAAISKTGEFVAIVNYDEIRIWDVDTNSLARTILPENALGGMPVTVLTFSPDGQMIAAGAFYRGFAWRTDSGTLVENGSIDTGRPVASLAISPDGKFFAAGSTDGIVHIKDLETGEQFDQPPPSSGVDITTGQPVMTNVSGHRDEVGGLAFSPDSQMLVSASNDQTFIIWSSWHWPLEEPVNIHHAPLIGVTFDPVNGMMASLDVNGIVILWDTKKSSNLFQFPEDDQFPLDLTDGQSLLPEECMSLVKQPESSCIVSPDGKWMISYYLLELYGVYANSRTRDSVIGIWDFQTRQLIGQQTFPSYEPDAMLFSVDNRHARMIGNTYGSPFIVVNLDIASWENLACAIANRNLSQDEWNRYLGDTPYQTTCQ